MDEASDEDLDCRKEERGGDFVLRFNVLSLTPPIPPSPRFAGRTVPN